MDDEPYDPYLGLLHAPAAIPAAAPSAAEANTAGGPFGLRLGSADAAEEEAAAAFLREGDASMSIPTGEASSADAAPDADAASAAKKRGADRTAAAAAEQRAADDAPAASSGDHVMWAYIFLGSFAVVLGAAALCLARQCQRHRRCRRHRKAARKAGGGDGATAREDGGARQADY